ncbi:anti-sigma regulatory factor [Halalkalibacterium halodurans]|uniref:Positive regulator of sigma-B activity (Switch protein/serine-threonine kinase) n=1 Tax=Halalkalibacterium halodurans (strain ATCC BAA-125 / DSM 18197 / FERM 7344 / JCM 9153 / C-125) TaxID=272558 RepID=Q9KFF4_HALH5|nr:anti-sigma regulatory factor [Halalkalibacterium halodurans]MDY7221022.1 anti-sigma regulatory factor [Halalkalibacterium halodurans]MDY7240261.1 anti-sigma regulatory factor [Halalkalibacterium halodurans]MED4079912.1 anti-sigma regulatory factor [Halalkalibacterium halodurans]MED4085269.1 anti-sigma regulatory factor [Halalkalibacterium halodurans]MED4103802.1 anti-sigma regulatory factor [Halalkalibacterium halodurans]
MKAHSCSVEIRNEWGIVAARQEGRALAKQVGFGNVDQARITTAISELARNIYLYAERGQIVLEEVERLGKHGMTKGIKIISEDKGPGIEDIKQVMEDGFTTSGGLGAGLPGVKRLMDEFYIESTKGQGTVITAIKWLRS